MVSFSKNMVSFFHIKGWEIYDLKSWLIEFKESYDNLEVRVTDLEKLNNWVNWLEATLFMKDLKE